jgi:hypothetical protein
VLSVILFESLHFIVCTEHVLSSYAILLGFTTLSSGPTKASYSLAQKILSNLTLRQLSDYIAVRQVLSQRFDPREAEIANRCEL